MLRSAFTDITTSVANLSTSDKIALATAILAFLALVATVFAVVYAIRSYGQAVREAREDQLRQRATDVRASIERLKQLWLTLYDPDPELSKHTPITTALIVGSASFAQAFTNELPEQFNKAEVESLLGDKARMASLAAIGWYSAPTTAQFSATVQSLRTSTSMLEGKLSILRATTLLFLKILFQHASETTFFDIIDITGKVLTEGLSPYVDSGRKGDFRAGLAKILQSSSLGWFAESRHERVSHPLVEFHVLISEAFQALADEKLVSLIRTEFSGLPDSMTISGSIRDMLAGLSADLDTTTFNKAQRKLNEVEKTLSQADLTAQGSVHVPPVRRVWRAVTKVLEPFTHLIRWQW